MKRVSLHKIVACLCCLVVLGALMFFTHPITATAAEVTAPTDVYWGVSQGTLILSSELGNTGLTKWTQASIAAVTNAAHVPWNETAIASFSCMQGAHSI